MLQLALGVVLACVGGALLLDLGSLRTGAAWWNVPGSAASRSLRQVAGILVSAGLLAAGLVSAASGAGTLVK